MCPKHNYFIMNIWYLPISQGKDGKLNTPTQGLNTLRTCMQTVSKENQVQFKTADKGRTCLRQVLPKMPETIFQAFKIPNSTAMTKYLKKW